MHALFQLLKMSDYFDTLCIIVYMLTDQFHKHFEKYKQRKSVGLTLRTPDPASCGRWWTVLGGYVGLPTHFCRGQEQCVDDLE